MTPKALPQTTTPSSALITRRRFLATSLAACAAPGVIGNARNAGAPHTSMKPARANVPVPTPAQLAWQRDERALFLHFGVTTFTDKEWGDGTDSATLFNPTRLDAGQWARTARATGFPAMLLTAKHHDGFCLWPTKTTAYSVAASPWRGGTGDVVREFVDACRTEGIKPGLYCSPWDRNAPSFGEGLRYNELYLAQLTELLTGYGDIHQLWFDGATGTGPNGDRQEYDWPRVFALVRKLQPNAIIFSDAGPDARWSGNDRADPSMANWSRMDPAVVPHPGAEGPRVNLELQTGSPTGTVWRPGETDVSIRPSWYHHSAENRRIKQAGDLVTYYFSSVGRNSKLLLNVPPNREGLLSDLDVASLTGMHTTLTALFKDDVTQGARQTWTMTGAKTAELVLELVKPARLNVLSLREDIAQGQSVARYVTEGFVDNAWTELSRGTTIGNRALDRIQSVVASRLRVRIEDSVDTLHRITLSAYAEPLPSARLP